MRLLLAFTPFHTPTSPPLGLAYLNAVLGDQSGVDAKVVDWNVAFFRRWLTEEMPDLCQYHPSQLLGTVCPSMLVSDGKGQNMIEELSQYPETSQEQYRYMKVAQQFDEFYNHLSRYYHDLLYPYVERRMDLSDQAVEAIFHNELNEIREQEPDVVGFSILAEQNFLYSLALGRAIHEKLQIPIILGGAMMSHLDSQEILQGFPWIKYIITGEAERSILQFLEAWPEEGLEGVDGLTHFLDGKACSHGRGDLPALERVAVPDFDAFPLESYLTPSPVLPILSSRGCYWGKCAFCSHTLPYGERMRVRNPRHVLDEIEFQMSKHAVRHFLFVDEAISPAMVKKISEGIQARGFEVRFGMEGVRVEEAFNSDLLRNAHEAGLRWVYVGVESSVQRILDFIDKGINIATIERFIHICERVGITPQLSFILGLPSTTKEELNHEMEFMREYPVDSSPFVLLFGSPMYERPEDYGIRIEDQEVLYLTPDGPVHTPRFYFTADGVSPAEASGQLAELGQHRHLRPHLGEVHALQLADSSFFEEEDRSSSPPQGARSAIGVLQKRPVESRDALWFTHILGCLETQGKMEVALNVAQAGLVSTRGKGAPGPLLLHLAAILNHLDHPRAALQLIQKMEGIHPSLRGAVKGEKVRALHALGQLERVVVEAKDMLSVGYEIPWIYLTLGLCYECLDQPQKALDNLEKAAKRNWLEPEINRAKARCLHTIHQEEKAIAEREKAKRKLKWL